MNKRIFPPSSSLSKFVSKIYIYSTWLLKLCRCKRTHLPRIEKFYSSFFFLFFFFIFFFPTMNIIFQDTHVCHALYRLKFHLCKIKKKNEEKEKYIWITSFTPMNFVLYTTIYSFSNYSKILLHFPATATTFSTTNFINFNIIFS